jgi:hypothetical protein
VPRTGVRPAVIRNGVRAIRRFGGSQLAGGGVGERLQAGGTRETSNRENSESRPCSRGAFSRFRPVLDRHPDQVGEWLTSGTNVRLGQTREWLASDGYDALPPCPADLSMT